MKLRRGPALAAGLGLMLLAAVAVAVLMQPRRLAGLVLGGVGRSLGLEIGFDGGAQYRLRGPPMLEVHGLDVRRAGDGEAILRAGRARVSLPWSTLRDRSTPLALHGVELDAPVLDLPRLQAWLATRPPGDGSLPALSEGIRIRDGRVLADGWELRGLALHLPRLSTSTPLAADAQGALDAGALRIGFDLRLAASRPAASADVRARGRVRIEGDGWRIPAFVSASGPLRVADGSWRLAPLHLGASGAFEGDGEPLAFALGVHGPLRLRDGVAALAPAGLALRGEGVVPVLDASGSAAWGRALFFRIEGAMPGWPAAWPALPSPLATVDAPIAIRAAYAGATDLASPLALELRQDGALAQASGRIPELLRWFDAGAGGTPLPPLQGRASAPRIEVPGGLLEGVEISIEPGSGP